MSACTSYEDKVWDRINNRAYELAEQLAEQRLENNHCTAPVKHGVCQYPAKKTEEIVIDLLKKHNMDMIVAEHEGKGSEQWQKCIDSVVNEVDTQRKETNNRVLSLEKKIHFLNLWMSSEARKQMPNS